MTDSSQEMTQLRADAATVVHALDTAVQLVEALIAFSPEGSPLSPDVGIRKAALDQAMANMRRPSLPEEVERLETALKIACNNLAQTNVHREHLVATLQSALTLIDAMMSEVARLPNLPISIVIARNNFADMMSHLLRGGRIEPSDPAAA